MDTIILVNLRHKYGGDTTLSEYDHRCIQGKFHVIGVQHCCRSHQNSLLNPQLALRSGLFLQDISFKSRRQNKNPLDYYLTEIYESC